MSRRPPGPPPLASASAGIGAGRDILDRCDMYPSRQVSITFAAARYGGQEGARQVAHGIRTAIYLARGWRRKRYRGTPLATSWDDYTVNVYWNASEQAYIMTVRPSSATALALDIRPVEGAPILAQDAARPPVTDREPPSLDELIAIEEANETERAEARAAALEREAAAMAAMSGEAEDFLADDAFSA